MCHNKSKGFFHRFTGTPFTVFIFGNSNTYRGLQDDLTLMRSNRKRQLTIKENLEQQLISTQFKVALLEESVNQNGHDIQLALTNLEEAQKVLSDAIFDSPVSLKPRISGRRVLDFGIGRIPIIGEIYTVAQMAFSGKQIFEAKKIVAIEKEALQSIREFGESRQEKIKLSRQEAAALHKQYDIENRILESINASINQKKFDISKL